MSHGIDESSAMLEALQRIAAGRDNCGTPLPREKARQIAREAMVAIGRTWPTMKMDADGRQHRSL
jgi:hypothetical protein